MALIVRLPNWLGDMVMALPLLAALSRRQQYCVFSGQAAFAPLLAAFGFEQEYRPLPPKNWAYYRHFWRQRGQFSQAILLANSQRSDMEAWLARIPQRYGIAWPGRPRRLLTHRYLIKHPEDDGGRHQSHLWADFTAHFGFHEGLSFAPLLSGGGSGGPIVLICGSENSPEKRWPAAQWSALIRQLRAESGAPILLSGTAKDRDLCQSIADAAAVDGLENLAGTTSMVAFFQLLREAQCVIGNDTGGLHLANAAGRPAIGLYGPTNPQRTRPIFESPLAVLQPPGCPAAGGGQMADIGVAQVMQAWRELGAAG